MVSNMSFFWKRRTDNSQGFEPGITPRSLAVTVLCILMAAMYTNLSCAYLNEHPQIVEQAIPIPAMLAILFSTMMVGIVALVARRRFLTRSELVCIAFATLMAAPMMSGGFWQRFFGILTAVPRAASFDYIDVYDDGLWPHGRNILSGAFDEVPAEQSTTEDTEHTEGLANRKTRMTSNPTTASFTNISWSAVEYEEGVEGRCPTIANTSASDETWLEFRLPVDLDDPDSIVPSHPHLVSVLAYIENSEAESEVFCRAYADDNQVPETLMTSSMRPRKTFIHRKGFVRMGAYGVVPARVCSSNLIVQLGYRGRGKVTFADPKLFSVYAVESCFRGRKMIDEAEWLALAPDERPAGAVVRPSNMWSAKGLSFLVRGHIPLRDWARPALLWSSFVLMLLGAIFCVNVVMRRQWADSERYPMPNSRIPLALVGAGDGEASPWASIWRNRSVWAGMVFALAFGLLKGWHCYNLRIPDPTIDVALNEYVSNPAFGNMFNTHFVFLLTVCSIAVFFELNVLISIVVGFWVCRSAYCLGHLASLDMNNGFPWRDQAAVGSYLGYFVVIVALSGKYILSVLKDAVRGRGGEGEALSPRTAVFAILFAHVGVAAWAHFAGAPALPTVAFFAFLVALGFVCAKFRAECGSPYGYFTPYNSMVLVTAAGGFTAFGAKGVFMSLLLSGCLTVTTFYLLPGMQFELIETGRRMRINPRHIALTCLIGALGGLFIGGWGFLTHGYADGGENIRGSWLFSGFSWFVSSFRDPLAKATNDWLNAGAGPLATSPWESRAMIFGGCVMAVLTVLRHYLSGFWFHPIGFLLGWTNMDSGAPWGTLLVAWLIRYATLKIGGARAVRDRLLPFFTGVFIGCMLSVAVMTIVNAGAYFSGSPDFARILP